MSQLEGAGCVRLNQVDSIDHSHGQSFNLIYLILNTWNQVVEKMPVLEALSTSRWQLHSPEDVWNLYWGLDKAISDASLTPNSLSDATASCPTPIWLSVTAPGRINLTIVRLPTLGSFQYSQYLLVRLQPISAFKNIDSSLLYLNLFGVLRELAMEELVLRLKGEVVSWLHRSHDSSSDIEINKFMFTSVARPTVGIKRYKPMRLGFILNPQQPSNCQVIFISVVGLLSGICAWGTKLVLRDFQYFLRCQSLNAMFLILIKSVLLWYINKTM